mmetsp:Transcript_11676/g.43501  ORF Transcript_11676/g.43501 Transcript_11676/m.43501 type:complete len:284 (+) Transcript_11676:468-1319(+)
MSSMRRRTPATARFFSATTCLRRLHLLCTFSYIFSISLSLSSCGSACRSFSAASSAVSLARCSLQLALKATSCAFRPSFSMTRSFSAFRVAWWSPSPCSKRIKFRTSASSCFRCLACSSAASATCFTRPLTSAASCLAASSFASSFLSCCFKMPRCRSKLEATPAAAGLDSSSWVLATRASYSVAALESSEPVVSISTTWPPRTVTLPLLVSIMSRSSCLVPAARPGSCTFSPYSTRTRFTRDSSVRLFSAAVRLNLRWTRARLAASLNASVRASSGSAMLAA